METNKRDFNLAAKIILGLSIFSLIMGTITSFQNYGIYSSFGIGGSQNHYLIEAFINMLMIWAAILIFAKKWFGLIAFIVLGVLRVFLTIPTGTDVSTAYYLGGKTVLFLRDVGFFAIALCFRKNGISGWRSLLASDEWIEANYQEKSDSIEIKENISEGETVPSNTTSVIENDDLHAVNPMSAKKTVIEHYSTLCENPVSQIKVMVNKKSFAFKWWYVIVGLAVATALFFLFILIRPYPGYLESFSEKWNYTFHLPNNAVAKRLFDEAMTHHPRNGFLVVRGSNVEYKSELDVYRNLDSYKSSCKLYAIAGAKINNKSEVVDTCLYCNEVIAGGEFKFSLLTGRDLIDYYELIESNFKYVKNNLVKPHNVELEYTAEKNNIEIVHEIPVTDNDLISDMYIYYTVYQNKTLLQEYYDKNYKYNRNNEVFLIDYLDVLLYVECFDEAKRIATRLIKKDSRNTEALSTLSYVSAENGDWKEAESYAKKAVDYGTENLDAYFILAEAMYKKGNKEEARRIYNQGSNKDGYSQLEKKYKEAGGCPFKINSIVFSFKTYDGDIITDYGQKLYSSKSQYICPRINVTADRTLGSDDILQCKLYNNGRLERGGDSPNGYTFDWANNYIASSGMTVDLDVTGWGASYSGVWPAGNYRLEVYYNDTKIGEESFHIY